MELDLFIKIASVIGALGTIIGALIAIYKSFRKIEKRLERYEENDKSLKNIEKKIGQTQTDIENIHRHMLENYKSILQLKIVSPEMPMSERVDAANRYLSDEIKGNGGVKTFCNKYLFNAWAKEQQERSDNNAES